MENKGTNLEIPEFNDVIVGELAERGEWIIANIETNSFWPVKAQKVSYKGEIFWILPITKKYFPAIAIKASSGKLREECERLLLRFLSILSWVEANGFLVDQFSGGSLPVPMGREKTFGLSICEEFDLSYFPEPMNDKALLALALMREGRGLNHPGYAFLSFYRVMEVVFPDGKERAKWIRAHLDTITDRDGKNAISKLHAQGIVDVGMHLWESCRCAVAHAKEEPIIDPDDPSDNRRLWSDLPIIAALAQLAIEQELGVETSHTVWKNHLYELSGFKEIFGSELVGRLTSGEKISNQPNVNMPMINVQIRRYAPYAPLSNLEIKEIGQQGNDCFARFESKDGSIRIRFKFDFAEERLVFDLFDDLVAFDAGTADAAEAIAEIRRFSKEYFGNGQLHIYNAETGALLARKEAFTPLNM